MRAPVWLVLAILLSGCSTGGDPPTDDAPDSPDTITDPADINASLDGRPHVHDYWNGAAEVELLDATVRGRGTSLACQWDAEPAVKRCHTVQLEEGTIVPPGTGWVNVTVTWSTQPAADVGQEVRIGWRTAHDEGGGTADVTEDQDVSIDVSVRSADQPHSLVSKWAFTLSAWADTPVEFTIHVEAVAVRAPGPLPVAPPHPDHWGTNITRILHDEAGALSDMLGSGDGPDPDVFPEIVPPGTTRVTLRFHYNSTTPEALHYDPRLSWRGADRIDHEETDVPPDEQQPGQTNAWLAWDIDVEPRMWDSPYANRTTWRFDFDWRGGEHYGTTRGLVWMDGDYHLRIIAQRADDRTS